MPNFFVRSLSLLKQLAKHSWQFFTGVIITIVVFIGNFTDLKQPDVTIEITAVNSTSAEPIDLVRIPELSSLRELMEGEGYFRFSGLSSNFTPDEIDRQLLIMSNQVKTQLNTIDLAERRLDAVTANPTPDEETKLKEIEHDIRIFPSADILSVEKQAQPARARIDSLVKDLRNTLAEQRKANTQSTARLTDALKQWTTYKESVLPNKARLWVTCAIGNDGSGATSLKPQALLRANLGDGNYLDLPMKLSGYESTEKQLGQYDPATLQAHSFKVVRFQSEEVQAMNPADSARYKTFLGNVSPTTIFITDVRGHKYASNSVPFSPGVYEQRVYDSLKQFASKMSGR